LGERVGRKVRSNLPELANITFMGMIRWVSNGKYRVLVPNQLQALDRNVRHWEELINFIDKNSSPKEP
jgi:hypothetical protein